MSHRVLETDFPLMAPPNPPLHRLMASVEGGRNGSLRAAYSCEDELLPKPRGEEGRKSRAERAGLTGQGAELERILSPPSSSGCSSDTSYDTGSSLRSQGRQGLYRPPRHRYQARVCQASVSDHH